MSSTLCFRGQHIFFVFEVEYAICPYLARSGNLFGLRLIGRSIDGFWQSSYHFVLQCFCRLDLYLIDYIWLSSDIC
jgi:hypothetical protein